MATITSLPPEILLHIFGLAGESPASDLYLGRWRKRYATLRAAALVCRAWSHLAQKELWKKVEVKDLVTGYAFMDAVGVDAATTELRVDMGGDQRSERALEDLLACCRGLKNVQLTFLKAEMLDMLRLPQLAGVTSLYSLQIRRRNIPDSLATNSSTPFPFALTRLSFTYHTNFGLPFLQSLLQPSIKSLSLHGFVANDMGGRDELVRGVLDHLFPALATLAPRLSHLAIFFGENISVEVATAIQAAMKQCSNLRHFELSMLCGPKPLNEARIGCILSLLETLTVKLFNYSNSDGRFVNAFELLALLQLGLRALSKIRNLRLETEEQTLLDMDDGEEILELCEERAIEVEFLEEAERG